MYVCSMFLSANRLIYYEEIAKRYHIEHVHPTTQAIFPSPKNNVYIRCI